MNQRKKKYCSNCNKLVCEQDKFCKYCGVSVNATDYKPNLESMAQIYGPAPRKRTHLCEICGYSWTTFLMRDNEKYCPLCGGNAPISNEKD